MLPLVSIVMPVRNEAPTITEALDAIDRQTYPADRLEILVVDGRSTDATAAIVQQRMHSDPRLRLISGDFNCPGGMNAGIAAAQGSIVAKIDGHGYINPSFFEIAVRYLMEHPGCACIGGRIVPIGKTRTARSNLYMRFSRFAIGSSIYTAPATVHEADNIVCGVYRKAALVEVGGFDPELQFGEDEEVNHRLVRAGYKLVFQPGMEFHYYGRASFGSLFRQYQNYGAARVKVLRKHPGFFRLKHIVPSTLIVALVIALVLAPPFASLRLPAAGLLLTYGAFVGAGVVATGIRQRFFYFHYLLLSLLMVHSGYGIGMLQQVGRSALHLRAR
jgi:glycosyltransferase involved in cell wall biosynthesis